MKIKRVLEVTENEFFDYLENEFNRDFHNHTISVKSIEKGLKYNKTEEKTNSRISIIVDEYIRGSRYQVTFKNSFDTITVSYTTVPVANGLEIIFEQSLQNFETNKQNRLMRLFSEGVYLGRMSDTLFKIQKEIQEQRKLE